MFDVQSYRHLDNDDKVQFSITDTITSVRQLNYGQQRLLAELLKQREESDNYKTSESFKKHTEALRKLLESGFY